MINVEMDGFGDVLNKFERDADFELLGVDGVSGARVGDEFERDERRQLRQDVGPMVEKITRVITSFRDFRLSMQEYVCLKVVAMLTQEGKKIHFICATQIKDCIYRFLREYPAQRT